MIIFTCNYCLRGELQRCIDWWSDAIFCSHKTNCVGTYVVPGKQGQKMVPKGTCLNSTIQVSNMLVVSFKLTWLLSFIAFLLFNPPKLVRLTINFTFLYLPLMHQFRASTVQGFKLLHSYKETRCLPLTCDYLCLYLCFTL
jgi:hypothetical protein